MSENAASTRADDWKTIAEAAEILGVSERQARRYAGRLDGHDRQEAGHEAGHIATRVRVSAMRDLREKKTKTAQEADTAPDIATPEAGHEAGHKSERPDMRPDARVLAIETENALLKDALQRERENADQWRAQVEQHAQNAAQAMASVRELTKALNTLKALPSREYSQSENRAETPLETEKARGVPSPDAKQGAQTGAKRKLAPWQQIIARTFGIR
jgi:hypothetical protein